jgi:hypothetical protein
MSLPLREEGWYLVLLVCSILSLIGLGLRFIIHLHDADYTSLYAIPALAVGLSFVILLVLFVIYLNYPYQARYLFAGIVPQAVLLTAGWLGLFPRQYASLGLWVMLSGWLVLDVISIGFTVIPFYYHG